MKKIYIIVLSGLVFFAGNVIVFMLLGNAFNNDAVTDAAELASETLSVEETTAPPVTTTKKPMAVSMENSLFIGDSRTVGIEEYADMDGADFFAVVGMTVFEIDRASVNVPGMGYVKLHDILNHKKYDKVYIMLGVNEIGYSVDSIVQKYVKILEAIMTAQPDAFIFIQANLHVTSGYYYSNGMINNPAIDRLNQILALYEDKERFFFLDANPVFDDSTGNLAVSNSSDGIHLYGSCYARWGEWIKEQTAIICQEYNKS